MPRFSPLTTLAFAAIALLAGPASSAFAQDYAKSSPEALAREVTRIVDSRRGVMIPMRDGVALATDIYTPKNATGPLPTIVWKTPYNEQKLAGPTLRCGNRQSAGTKRRPCCPAGSSDQAVHCARSPGTR